MPNNLSEIQNIVYNRIIQTLRTKLPNLDVSTNTLFSDLFVRPMVEVISQEYELLNNIILQQSLSNASKMTVAQMDELGAKYFLTRRNGTNATGVVIIALNDIPIATTTNVTGTFTINAGIRATSNDRLSFISTDSITITDFTKVNYFNPETKRFEIPILFEALNIGSEYNIGPNQITSLDLPVQGVISVDNPAAFSGGTNRESNEAFALRIQDYYAAPNLGVVRGYKRFITSNFPESEEVLVVGFGDSLMKRDFVTIGGAQKHWGSKVDLYIKGVTTGTHFIGGLQVQKSGSDFFVEIKPRIGTTTNPLPVVDILSISTSGKTLSSASYSIYEIEDEEKTGTTNGEFKILFRNEVSAGDIVNVSYRYNRLISDIQNRMIVGEERPPTADVLVKAAKNKYVTGSIVVKPFRGIGLTGIAKSVIRQSFSSFIDATPMDQEIQFSDMINTLFPLENEIEPGGPVIDLIHQPTLFLLFSRKNTLVFDCLSESQQNFLMNITSINSALINPLKTYVTKYDFYNIINALLYLPGEENIDKVAATFSSDTTLPGKINHMKTGRTVLQLSKITLDMTPATSDTLRNEKFNMDYFAIFEYRQYSVNEWKVVAESLDKIVKKNPNSANIKTVEHLALFVLCIVFAVTQNLTSANSEENLVDYLKNVQVNMIV